MVPPEFLQSLFHTGDIVPSRTSSTAASSVFPAEDESSAKMILYQAESVWRLNCPGRPPEFDLETSFHAAGILHELCRAIVDREIEVTAVRAVVKAATVRIHDCLRGSSPRSSSAVHYSVDLVLCFLPQLAERASRISGNDKLLDVISELGDQWPLSAAGLKRSATLSKNFSPEFPAALKHATLWRMFVDRVIAYRDTTWLKHPEVREAVEASLGAFPELSPGLPMFAGEAYTTRGQK